MVAVSLHRSPWRVTLTLMGTVRTSSGASSPTAVSLQVFGYDRRKEPFLCRRRSAPLPRSAAGDALPPRCEVIETRVGELGQLFNAIDPSPFRQRDLDPRAEEFIVGWASDLRMDRPWALVVHLERPAGRPDEAEVLRGAIHEYFGQRLLACRRRLRELFRRGRISLAIALTFLAASIAVGDTVAGYLEGSRVGDVIREGCLIGGWVAMWRPLEVFLYDWWPIRAPGRLLERRRAIPRTCLLRASSPIIKVGTSRKSSASRTWW